MPRAVEFRGERHSFAALPVSFLIKFPAPNSCEADSAEESPFAPIPVSARTAVVALFQLTRNRFPVLYFARFIH